MLLLLVRHAIAEPRDRRRWPNDTLRPLSARGRRRFQRAAHGLARVSVLPELCFTSPLRRARQTAAMLHDRADWPVPATAGWLAPDGQFERPLTELAPPGVACVGLVGHEPALGRLLSWLIAGNESLARTRLRKGAIACIDCGPKPARGGGTLQWLLSPRALRAIGARR